MHAQEPRAQDPVDAWFEPTLSQRLARAGLYTLLDLVLAIRSRARWYAAAPGVGAVKAAQIESLLTVVDGEVVYAAGPFADLGDGPAERICLLSHHPMHMSPGSFDQDEMATLDALPAPPGDAIWGAIAGHYHADGDEPVGDGGYQVHVLDSVHETDITVAVVTVRGNDERFAWDLERVVLPYDG